MAVRARHVVAFAVTFVLGSVAFAAGLPAEQPKAVLAEARAARDAGAFARAEQLARIGMAQSDDPVWPLTLALVLADQRRTKEALAILQMDRATPLPAQQRLLAEAYTQRQGGDAFAALRAYGEVLLRDPDNAEARAALASILDDHRGPHGAARLGGLPLSRSADQAAALVRWGSQMTDDSQTARHALTDRALVAFDGLLARLAADPAADPALRRRVRVDRLLALRDRGRMTDVVNEAEALKRDGALPPYALQAEADARLQQRQPAAALQLYEQLLAAAPDNLQAAYGRVFALVETEQLRKAMSAADAIASSRPRFIGFGGDPARTPDPEVVYASLLAGQVRLWSNFEPQGYRRLQLLAQAAPANADLRAAMSGGHSARGHNRAAEAEALAAVALDPDGLTPQIAVADTALARRRFAAAGASITRLLARAPDDQRVVQLHREWRAATGWRLEADGSQSFANGGGSNRRGDGHAVLARLSTPLISNRLRLYAEAENNRAVLLEGASDRTRLAGGIAIEAVDLVARAHVAANLGTLDRASAGASLDWSINDRWGLSVEAEHFSRQTPLRALLYGISADAFSSAVRFRAHERLEATVRGGWLGYTDGNDRWWASALVARRLATAPHFDLTGRAELAMSANSAPGGPYFAPERDLSGTVGLSAQHVSWRRYQRSFVQALDIDAGPYWQRGFAGAWIASVRYEHRWRFDPWRELVYGIGVSRRVYDGEAERLIAISAGLRQRF